ncbi:thioredoxin domain-containing protein [Marinifilum sp. D737]|uniref:thioredoxin domain-containing protein n=1 Tax=Marinifilum sp. D737 TaxID=2969628 RepID=UPI00227259D1|nr:thioredoxin domain-containing protein [Marinifilum sp. D737]MCY1633712.1 thioredoxin domain-containing protein [Marinifilum sp. D737]
MKVQHTNRLSQENSPYLLQHAHNPVDWYPWGEEALQKAKNENKVILVSIGYAACHWCHVMERESFENEEIAKIMNEFFVCIKVDREERPDIDRIYMDAVQLMTGSGGWPLNCFAMPDGKPFFGGTYFRPNDWVRVLQGIQNAWLSEKDKVEKVADQISEGVRSNELIEVKSELKLFDLDDMKSGYENWQKDFDKLEGGNNRAPKFPLPGSLQFLLRYYHASKDRSALDHVVLTLDKMAAGGIYDQIGGGFARYSVDAIWKVPHFEKMLYDNAQLVSLYAEAYSLTKITEYKRVMEETLDFIDRELSLPNGGFYSSLDADSEGVEGKFYVWEKSEIESVLKEDAEWFCEYFGVSEKANWEEGNILMISADKNEIAKRLGISTKQFDEKVKEASNKLLSKREERIRPGLDDKALTSWNALMIKGYVDAYKALGKQEYLERAEKAMHFIETNLMKGEGHLFRNYKDGVSKINAFLDDYSFTIEAYIALYQASFKEDYLIKADRLMKVVMAHFSDEKSGMFFYTSNEDPDLIARKMELLDNVIPSSNSSIAKSLFVLGIYLDKETFKERSKQMLANVYERMLKVPSYHFNWGQLFFYLANSTYELVVVGDSALSEKQKIESLFLPNVLISGSLTESELPLLKNRYVSKQTTFYLCKNRTCKIPVTSVEELLDQLQEEISE